MHWEKQGSFLKGESEKHLIVMGFFLIMGYVQNLKLS